MATAFKQVSNNAKAVVTSNALNNTTSPLTFSVQTGKGALFPSPGNGFYITAYDPSTYSDPSDDPNMRVGLCTARSTDSLTVTWGQFGTPVVAIPGTPTVFLGVVDQLMEDIHTAINALEAILGTGAGAPSAGKVLRGTGAGTSAWGQVDPTTDIAGLTSATLRGLLSDETGSGAAVFAISPTIVTPTIASFVNANHDHSNSAGGGSLGAGVVTNAMLAHNAAWTSYSPSWTAAGTAPALGNGSLSGWYQQIGKTVHFKVKWVAGSTTTFGTGNWRFTLPPVTPASNEYTPPGSGVGAFHIGGWYAENPGILGYSGGVRAITSTTIEMMYTSSAAGAQSLVTNLQPATWANTWYIMLHGTYEAA